MDPRNYYHKIRETAKTLTEEFYVVVSKETSDGGRAGVLTEVPRQQVAKLLVEDRARLATAEEVGLFNTENDEKRQADKTRAEASQFQLLTFAEKFIRASGPAHKQSVEKRKE